MTGHAIGHVPATLRRLVAPLHALVDPETWQAVRQARVTAGDVSALVALVAVVVAVVLVRRDFRR